MRKRQQDTESGLVRLPSASRQSLDPCSHSRETPSIAGTAETDGCLDNEQAESRGGAAGSGEGAANR